MIVKTSAFTLLDFCFCIARATFIIIPFHFLKGKHFFKSLEENKKKEDEKKVNIKPKEKPKTIEDEEIKEIQEIKKKYSGKVKKYKMVEIKKKEFEIVEYYIKNIILFQISIFMNTKKFMAMVLINLVQVFYVFKTLHKLDCSKFSNLSFILQEIYFLCYAFMYGDFIFIGNSLYEDSKILMMYLGGILISVYFLIHLIIETIMTRKPESKKKRPTYAKLNQNEEIKDVANNKVDFLEDLMDLNLDFETEEDQILNTKKPDSEEERLKNKSIKKDKIETKKRESGETGKRRLAFIADKIDLEKDIWEEYLVHNRTRIRKSMNIEVRKVFGSTMYTVNNHSFFESYLRKQEQSLVLKTKKRFKMKKKKGKAFKAKE